MSKNQIFRQLHIYLSLFFLPMAFIFAITGIVYIFGFDQNFNIKEQNFIIKTSIENGKEKEFLFNFLKENNLKIPSNMELKNDKRNGGLSTNGVHYSINIKKINDNEYKISTETRSLLGDLIMLHKNKGAWYFSVFSVTFGIALFFLYFSGLFITLFTSKKNRKKQIYVLLLGIFITFLLAYLSL
ncbi:hypothetical protein [Campylobacter novaezeelandiae]|uniref:hypothetical protein n=1 Tax=Campylobacter novaezeelandiae TaxID=2267891 RepID=UPI0019065DE2|nr:hypothetical protein [Campylobacter novaezeelandiae]MBK1964288.1 hypothetical protein [Campylobacter novaezeelandiae]MBK1993394.1 hypothetical protein [Campylobacter novaezeelandiae]